MDSKPGNTLLVIIIMIYFSWVKEFAVAWTFLVMLRSVRVDSIGGSV